MLSLIQSVENGPHVSFSIHPLIWDWLQLRNKSSQRKKIWQESASLLSIVIKNSFADKSSSNKQQELLAHLDSCLSNSSFMNIRDGLGSGSMREETISFSTFYREHGRYKESQSLFERLLQDDKSKLEKNHPSTLTSMANLASTYRNQGRWKEAEELEVQVMKIRKRVLGVEHPDTLTSMGNLASTYSNQGQWKEAEELDVQVMEIRRRALGEEHPSTLTSMANLASTYRNQGRWKEAEKLEV